MRISDWSSDVCSSDLVADLYNRPNPTFEPGAADDPTTSLGRWRQLVRPLLSPEAVRLHRRFDSLRFAVSEVARRSRSGRRDHRLFVSQLTDLVTAFLTAPVSEETRDRKSTRLNSSH